MSDSLMIYNTEINRFIDHENMSYLDLASINCLNTYARKNNE